MKVAKTSAIVALLLAMMGIVSIRGAAAGTKQATIFVANNDDVTAYPAGSSGDVAPIAVTTDMSVPNGIARDASGRIYVTNNATNTVTVYAANASGNVPPIAVIGGSKTKLTDPKGIALDASGMIYVLNGENRKGSIMVYPPVGISTGILNEAPIATIAGSKTRLHSPGGIALDSLGNIYVANESGGPVVPHERYDRGSVTVYPAGSDGNIAPIATISGAATGLAHPVGIALDSSGNIYVANIYTANTTRSLEFESSITVYPAGSKGNASPIAIIAGNNTGLDYAQGIALDSSRNLYVSGDLSYGSGVNAYPAGSNGNVSPSASIAGTDTGLASPDGITLDSGGNLYVSNSFGGTSQSGSLTVYRAGSSGDAVPTTTITSNFIGIDFASGIALDSTGNIYVANEFGGPWDDGTVTIYSAGSYATSSPIATIAGGNTELSNPIGIALDSGDNIFVLNDDNAITVYPAGSAGDVMPQATINIDTNGTYTPVGMAAGTDGDLYVVNQGGVKCNKSACYPTNNASVAVYRAGSDGNAKPIAVIAGPNTELASPSAIAVDHSGDICVTNQGPYECECGLGFCACYSAGPGSVTVYAPGSNGDVKPITTISGINTGIGSPYGITLDSYGNIYVLNDGLVVGAGPFGIHQADGRTAARKDVTVVGQFYELATRSVEPILIFAAGSNGDVAPITGIGGPFTALYGPNGIAIGPAGP
jgi:sugar lactone lactonase YvrE